MANRQATAKYPKKIEERVEKLERLLDKNIAAEKASNTLVERLAEATKVQPESVKMVLDELGLKHLEENLSRIDYPQETIDEGRLYLFLVSPRHFIAA